MPDHIYYSNEELKGDVSAICQQIANTTFKPDLIVGIARGGLIPAVMLSHYYEAPMMPLNLSLRDGKVDATVGYTDLLQHIVSGKNILIVEDICDSGMTFRKVFDQIGLAQESEPKEFISWQERVKTATLWHNISQDTFECDFVGREISRADDERWIIFPFEDWWKR